MYTKVIPLIVGLFSLNCVAEADDWSQWLGSQRDSVWRESGIVKAFPSTGLPVKWRSPVGLGYGGPAVVSGRVYLMDYVHTYGAVENQPDSRKILDGTERVLCLDSKTGNKIWKHLLVSRCQ